MGFAWLKAQKQPDFVQGFGVEMGQLPMLVAVKVGKRNRFAKLEGALELASMGGFLDRILGGDMTFAALKPLPELEPPYLQGDDDGGVRTRTAATRRREAVATRALRTRTRSIFDYFSFFCRSAGSSNGSGCLGLSGVD